MERSHNLFKIHYISYKGIYSTVHTVKSVPVHRKNKDLEIGRENTLPAMKAQTITKFTWPFYSFCKWSFVQGLHAHLTLYFCRENI